jgi:hypothetical protein
MASFMSSHLEKKPTTPFFNEHVEKVLQKKWEKVRAPRMHDIGQCGSTPKPPFHHALSHDPIFFLIHFFLN